MFSKNKLPTDLPTFLKWVLENGRDNSEAIEDMFRDRLIFLKKGGEGHDKGAVYLYCIV